MARKGNPIRDQRLGELAPYFKFFLNPYSDMRFTGSCPGCSAKTKQRKLPLAIHVDDWGIVVLNKTCRFCPTCDLLIAHQNEVEGNLAQLFEQTTPEVIGNDYLVMGTVEREYWRRGLNEPMTIGDIVESLHDFKDYLQYEPASRWEFTG